MGDDGKRPGPGSPHATHVDREDDDYRGGDVGQDVVDESSPAGAADRLGRLKVGILLDADHRAAHHSRTADAAGYPQHHDDLRQTSTYQRHDGEQQQQPRERHPGVDEVAEELLRAVLKRHEEVLDEFRRRWPDAAATESGLLYVVHTQGEGPAPDFGAKVLLRYTGSLIDGTQFGTSGLEPMEFTIGAVVKGLEEMLLEMRRGGSRTVLIPPDLGYGAMGVPGTVPPRAFLIFDVELVDFSN